MKKKPVLVSDVDFVLLDWCAGLKPFLIEKGMEHEHIEQFVGSTYYPKLEELFLEPDENINIQIMKEFNDSQWIEHLPMFQKDQRAHLESLSETYDIIALTCLGTGEHQKEKRTNNLINHYGDVFHEVACIEVRESKEHYLQDLVKEREVVGFVDDRVGHLQEGIKAGIRPFLYVKNAPIPETDITVIDCLSSVRDILRQEEENKNKNRNRRRMRR